MRMETFDSKVILVCTRSVLCRHYITLNCQFGAEQAAVEIPSAAVMQAPSPWRTRSPQGVGGAVQPASAVNSEVSSC